jgi:hypothetical protein
VNDTTAHALPDEAAIDFAARMAEGLRQLGETARQLAPEVIAAMVPLAYLAAEDATSGRARKRARASLVRNGWVTAHELETLPEASATAIALERFRAWNEAI